MTTKSPKLALLFLLPLAVACTDAPLEPEPQVQLVAPEQVALFVEAPYDALERVLPTIEDRAGAQRLGTELARMISALSDGRVLAAQRALQEARAALRAIRGLDESEADSLDMMLDAAEELFVPRT